MKKPQAKTPANSRVRVRDAIIRTDFASYIRKVFQTLSPSTTYSDNWHIHAIAYQLERVRRGEIGRLIINLPPRSLKSQICSVAFSTFVLGHDPSKRIIGMSYSQDLATKHSNDCREVMSASWYRELFPQTKISRLKNTESEFATTRKGHRIATSIEGTLTGRGGDIIILDDPLKPNDALSDSKRERVNNAFFNTVLSRLDDKRTGAVIIVMQRLHEERELRSVLDDIRRLSGSDVFAAQYQQSPVPREGAMIKRKWPRRYNLPPERDSSATIIQSWDTAAKGGEQSNYSVCTTWLYQNNRYYLLDVYRERVDYPTLKAQVISLAELHNAKVILIEDAGFGPALAKELQNQGLPVIAVKPELDKRIRMSIQSVKFEGGQIFLPKEAPWLADFESELFSFPGGRHDDQIDSVSQALAYEISKDFWTVEALDAYARLSGFGTFYHRYGFS